MPRTAWAKLKDFPVYRPKFDEQRRTAEILDTVDAVIQQTEALIAKLKQMKAGLLHDLLTRGLDEHGEVRDPIAHSTQYKDSPVGRMPAEWQMDTLAKLAHGGISNGLFKKPELVGHGYHLVNVLDLYQNFGIDLSLVERVAVTEQEQRRYAVQTGDCFFTRSSLNLIGIAHCNVIRDVPEPCLFECHLMRVRPDQRRVLPEYLAHWCRSSWARKFFMARAKQTTMTTISQPDIAPLPVPLPSIDEQARVVKVIDAHDARIRAEEAYRDKLKLLKKGLMDDLLTGRVRVAVAMEAVS
jgi:type I restriction enzyme S subunit